MSRLRRHLSLPNVLATLLLAAVLATGAAVASGGPNVRKVDGFEIRGFEFEAAANTGPDTILKAGDLRLRASCDSGGDLGLDAFSATSDAVYFGHGNDGGDEGFELDVGDEQDLKVDGQRDAVYRSASGRIVAIHYAADDNDPLGGRADCLVAGYSFTK